MGYVSYCVMRAFRDDLVALHDPARSVWPDSQTFKSEVQRIALIEHAVSGHYLERLREDPDFHVYFVGRDSEDFRSLLLRLIDLTAQNSEEAVNLKSRTHKLVVSREVMLANGGNQKAIYDLLASQDLNAEVIAKREIAIFEAAPHGTSDMRLLAGGLLEGSRIPARELFKRVEFEVLFPPANDFEPTDLGRINVPARERLRNQIASYNKRSSTQLAKFFTEYNSPGRKSDQRHQDIVRQFGASGAWVVPTFDLSNALHRVRQTGLYTDDEILDILGMNHLLLLVSPADRELWANQYLAGDGLTNARELLDLSRERPSLRVAAGINGELTTVRGSLESKDDLPVNPKIVSGRRSRICCEWDLRYEATKALMTVPNFCK